MAKVSFDTAVSNMNSDSNNDRNSVSFFSLKNDGDEAIVRIMHDSVEDFDIVTLHPISIDGKYRSANCIREPRDPMDKCPLCKNGTKIQSKIFIHMIQYVANESGQIEAKPVVWERSISYATKLKNDIDEYGPLSNCIFKIRRNGKPRDMQTTYDMKLGNPSMYTDVAYPKVENAFDNYSACGTIVLDKTYEELEQFVTTGKFPETRRADNNDSTTTPSSNVPRNDWNNGVTNSYSTGDVAPNTPNYNPTNNGVAPNRPTRYY